MTRHTQDVTAATADPDIQVTSRLDGVDLLRAAAIFFVLMNHVNMRLFLAKIPYTDGLPGQLVASLVWSGQYGVQIFFAVSGFLITSTSLRRWRSLPDIRIREFYLLRFARIAPLLLLLLAVLSSLHLAGLRHFVVSADTGGLGRALLAALTFHINVLEARRDYLPANWDVLWSLSVEEAFYLGFPLFCALLGRGRWLIGALLVFVALGPPGRTVFAHGNEVWQEYSYFGGMDAIALGCLTALVRPRLTHVGATRLCGTLGAVLLAFTIGGSALAHVWGLARSGLDMTLVALGTCLLLIAAARTPWRSPRLLAPLLGLGQHSYEIYLTHMFVVFALFDAYLATDKPAHSTPLLFVGVIVLAAILGSAVARFYSEPMNRWLRRRWHIGPPARLTRAA
jgi:peptidoglycan/LPS O-acetylase OafA/YrhL